MTLPQVLALGADKVRSPLQMLPDSTAEAPSRHQSRIVMLIVLIFLALALVIAYLGTRDLGSGNRAVGSAAKPRVSASAPPVTAPAKSTPSSGPTVAAGRPVAILSATGFDPDGDRSERNSQAGRAYDDDLDTSWTSEGYKTVDFGGLKQGVGIILDLGQPTSARQVTLSLGSEPLDVTVYAATRRSLEGATEIGKASAASGRVQLDAAGDMPEAQYVIVWFTSLAPAGDQFRASIAEIALS